MNSIINNLKLLSEESLIDLMNILELDHQIDLNQTLINDESFQRNILKATIIGNYNKYHKWIRFDEYNNISSFDNLYENIDVDHIASEIFYKQKCINSINLLLK